MFKVGLCSVTFRNLSVEEVLDAAKQSKIQGIEWAADVHVPPGKLDHAERVASLTKDTGIETISYGSYYRLGERTAEYPFETILETAIKLHAPSIRVWAGSKGTDEATEEEWKAVIQDAKRIGNLAKKKEVHIHVEYHGQTLTDTVDSAKRLMMEVDHSNVSLYWQPALFETVEDRVKSIDQLKPWLSHVHVFHWQIRDNELIKHPFSKGVFDWIKYLEKLEKEAGIRYLMMEFVKDDKVEQLIEDTKMLYTLLP